MKVQWGFVFLATSIAIAQVGTGNVVPKVSILPIQPNTVALLHLAAGYTTSIRLPEEISSVVVGSPATFKAEHSEAEPWLVFLKPTTTLQSETNALITTKSGHEISLYLVSEGKAGRNVQVDFLVEYRRPHALAISADNDTFLIPETRSLSLPSVLESPLPNRRQRDALTSALEDQKELSLAWIGSDFRAAIGSSVGRGRQTIVAFSILNNSRRTIELLPPQLELSSRARGNGKRIIAEPIPISEYRITARRLTAGERADGVVVFERPAFKESGETLQLRLAEADQVDRPILLSLPFTPVPQGEVR